MYIYIYICMCIYNIHIYMYIYIYIFQSTNIAHYGAGQKVSPLNDHCLHRRPGPVTPKRST